MPTAQILHRVQPDGAVFGISEAEEEIQAGDGWAVSGDYVNRVDGNHNTSVFVERRKDMKHYRIGIVAGSHVFEFMCSTMSEAYDAVQDADCTFRLGIDMNKLMVNLVKMNAGELLSTIQHTLRLSIEDGEV